MNRKETTEFLSELLEHRLYSASAYWASEVSLDFGTINVRRVDYMEFRPKGVVYLSDIEKGTFVSYEVKSCKEDFHSGFGQNFETEWGYFVMPMSLYKEVISEIPHNVGVLVPVPDDRDKYDEFENPTPLEEKKEWKLRAIRPANIVSRKRSIVELLFAMLRSGH